MAEEITREGLIQKIVREAAILGDRIMQQEELKSTLALIDEEIEARKVNLRAMRHQIRDWQEPEQPKSEEPHAEGTGPEPQN